MTHTKAYSQDSVSYTKSSNKFAHKESTTSLTTQTEDLFPHNWNIPSSAGTGAAHMPVDLLHIAAWSIDEHHQQPVQPPYATKIPVHNFGETNTKPGAAQVHVAAWIFNEPHQHSVLPPYASTTTAHNSGEKHCPNVAEVDGLTAYDAAVHDNLPQKPAVASTAFHGPTAWRDQNPEQIPTHCPSSDPNEQYLGSTQPVDETEQFQSLTTYNLTRHTFNKKSEVHIRKLSTAGTEISRSMTCSSREVVGQ